MIPTQEYLLVHFCGVVHKYNNEKRFYENGHSVRNIYRKCLKIYSQHNRPLNKWLKYSNEVVQLVINKILILFVPVLLSSDDK